ncbi:hypothetical protein BAUCODRAFT_120077 [Baudoinia panamericana UAMH 10762]|uniref:Uncharacterized protein n=1 Tax=Baudoinia panamericana (strain UAMH 10762) TaxID=717646 RepID=M2LVT6_BAUPA|nr:uncharacterized protein BAUCODRAFT_120077 [Baudoinia panamericana UAMH 10762]EMC98777.1 hypothetical protein BAUCODRAFT_120077 [Baudoinia panamericana UAMH 10762]
MLKTLCRQPERPGSFAKHIVARNPSGGECIYSSKYGSAHYQKWSIHLLASAWLDAVVT